MSKQQVIVFKVSNNIKEKMIDYYDLLKRDKTPPYALFQAEEGGTIITLYESGKVVFQGISADIDANMWKDQEKFLNNRNIDEEIKEKDTHKNDKSYYYYSAIGSDEVGTGDYFGPIVVTATFVDKKDINFLEELRITDSKKMTDEKILRCAPIIMKKIPYATFTLSNKKFNELSSKGFNMNKIKAILHNKVLFELSNNIFAVSSTFCVELLGISILYCLQSLSISSKNIYLLITDAAATLKCLFSPFVKKVIFVTFSSIFSCFKYEK